MRARTRIYLSLALGALTTVAVAWTCAMLPATVPSNYITLNINEHGAAPWRQLNIQDDRRAGRRLYQLRTLYSIGPNEQEWAMTPDLRADIEDAMNSYPEFRGESPEASRELIDATGNGPANGWPRWPGWIPDIPRTDTGVQVFAARASGWPLLAMRSTAQSADRDVPARWRWSWRILTLDHYAPTGDTQIGAVPLCPMVLGFGADTLLYACLWWALLLGPGDVRRWNRRRLGLCEYCAYSLKGLPEGSPCPECGTARRVSDALLAHQREHQDDHQQQPKPAAGVVAPPPP